MTEQNTNTLDATFADFFAPTENTAGTGSVTRIVHGELTDVLVDAEEAEVFQARQQAEAAARNAHEDALWELMDRLN